MASSALGMIYGQFGSTASYTPPTGSGQSAVTSATVLLGTPGGAVITSDDGTTFADTTQSLRVRVSEITTVERGGRFVISSKYYVVVDAPTNEHGEWQCTVERRLRESSGENRMS